MNVLFVDGDSNIIGPVSARPDCALPTEIVPIVGQTIVISGQIYIIKSTECPFIYCGCGYTELISDAVKVNVEEWDDPKWLTT